MADLRVTRLTLEVMEGEEASGRVTRAALEAAVQHTASGRATRVALEVAYVPHTGRVTRAALEAAVQETAAGRATRAALEAAVQEDPAGRATRVGLEVAHDPSVAAVAGRVTRAGLEIGGAQTAAGRIARVALEVAVGALIVPPIGRFTRVALEVAIVPPPPDATPAPAAGPTACVHDHEEVAVRRLIQPYKRTRIQALLRTWVAEIQELEDALCALAPAFYVRTAIGDQLRILGETVGQASRGLPTETYRLWIMGRIMVNRSKGLARQLIAIAQKLSGSSVQYIDEYPAALTIVIDDPIPEGYGQEIAMMLQQAAAAGVRVLLRSHVDEDVFEYSDTDEAILDSNRGFDSGAYADVHEAKGIS